jgi:hypothetical protein
LGALIFEDESAFPFEFWELGDLDDLLLGLDFPVLG